MEQIFEQFTFTVIRLNKLIQKIKTAEMKPYGLKAIHSMCLYYLSGNALTAGELVKLTLEDKGAVSRALKQLKEKGYVLYNGSYHEKIALTEKGRELAASVSVRAECAVKAGSTALSDSERALFFETLRNVAENLTEYDNTLERRLP